MIEELFIIRHGETDLNKEGIVQGRGVNPSLNETGRLQADRFYKTYSDEGFEMIYASSLRRSQESVQQFVLQGLPNKQDADLDEISWGIFEGKVATPEFKAQYRDLLNHWRSGYLDKKAPGGESPLEVRQRQKRFIRKLMVAPQKKVLICMHGRAMRIFLPTLLEEDLRTMEEYPHHNLTLYKLIYRNGRFSINLFNNMDHLHDDGKN